MLLINKLYLAKQKNPLWEFFLKFDLIFILSLPHLEGIFINYPKLRNAVGRAIRKTIWSTTMRVLNK